MCPSSKSEKGCMEFLQWKTRFCQRLNSHETEPINHASITEDSKPTIFFLKKIFSPELSIKFFAWLSHIFELLANSIGLDFLHVFWVLMRNKLNQHTFMKMNWIFLRKKRLECVLFPKDINYPRIGKWAQFCNSFGHINSHILSWLEVIYFVTLAFQFSNGLFDMIFCVILHAMGHEKISIFKHH